MSHDAEIKSIPVGTRTNNKCCTCCTKCWGNPDVPGERSAGSVYDSTHTEWHCCKWNHDDPVEQIIESWGFCIHSCCSCPPMESLCMTVNVTPTPAYCPVDGTEWHLTVPQGATNCRLNPTRGEGGTECYFLDGDKSLITGIQDYENDWEKWGWFDVKCGGNTVDGCDTAGEEIRVSLCCCDSPTTLNTPKANAAECNTCSYMLHWEWIQQLPTNPDYPYSPYCSCPDCDPDFDDDCCHFIPFCADPGGAPCDGSESPYGEFTFITGRCPTGENDEGKSPGHDFFLQYELNDVYWNCDCCMAGCGEADTVNITATIVRCDGACEGEACSGP